MRKTLLVIAALFATAQVFAVTVTLSVDDEGGGWAAIRYSSTDANVSGFGLMVTTDSGAIFTGEIKDYNVGECTASVQGYGIFPGTIIITDGVVDDNGTPVAPNTAPGAEGTGPDTNTLILEMGALYVEGNEPDMNGTLILVKVDGDCNVCVEGEPIRGNIVLTNGTPLDPDMACGSITIVTECYAGMADYDQWEEVEKPECWCYPRQCHGDADGKKEGNIATGYTYVDQGDLAIMALGWKVKDSDNGGRGVLDLQIGGVPVACADFAHEKAGNIATGYTRIDQPDLALMATYWKVKEPGQGPGTPDDCLPGNRTPP